MNRDRLNQYRFFLKDSIRKVIDFSQTDQNRGLPPPPVQKPYSDKALRIKLPEWRREPRTGVVDLATAIGNRRSRRAYDLEPLTLRELSFLLWATQGIRRRLDAGHATRTVPSAGCRHSFETYLCNLKTLELERGIYRYLPLEHALLFEFTEDDLERKIVRAVLGQPYPAEASVTFIWTTIPYRMEWRYGLAAHKVIALDAGHVCQNLYLACEAIGAGTCAIAAYDQEYIDRLLRVDGVDEYVIYLAPVGKTKK
ncbi:MAG: SagB/ThcOx family dehydrogenase [Deltaproteobacteria bacterium]|nr:SagB/ThcOx family dehydrogenase [Deltaproteobacteria bacterium]